VESLVVAQASSLHLGFTTTMQAGSLHHKERMELVMSHAITDNNDGEIRRIRFQLTVILLTGFLLRSLWLGGIPPAMNSDELLKAFDGASVYRTGMDHHGESWPLFFKQSGEYSPPLYIYFAGLFSAPFGVNAYTVRLPSTILGTLSILMAYLFLAEWAGRKTALLTAALVAVSPWNIHYSRIGWEAISLIPLQLAGLWLYMRWTRTRRLRDALGSAVVFGLTVYAYPTARLSIPLLLLGIALLDWKRLRVHWRHTLAVTVTLMVMVLPYVWVFIHNQEAMQARWNFVSVFNRSDGWTLLIHHYFMHFSPAFLFGWGSSNALHDLSAGLALAVLFPFFLAGLVHLFRPWTFEKGILLVWLLTFSIPSSMTYDKFDLTSMPSSLRAVGGMPVLEIVSALGIVWIVQWLQCAKCQRRLCWLLALSIVVNVSAIAYDYIFRFPVYAAPAFQVGLDRAVQIIEAEKSGYDRIIVSHHVRLHPVAMAVYSGRAPGPFGGDDYPKYVIPFFHYVPMYLDFRMKDYTRYSNTAQWYNLAKGKNLILVGPREITAAEPQHTVRYPDGSIAYKIYAVER